MKVIIKYLSLLMLATTAEISAQNESTGSKLTKTEAKEVLDHHNQARKEVGTPPLTWSSELSIYAQQWADHLASQNCAFEHRPDNGEWAGKYGENIFMGSGSLGTPLEASKGWYSEIKTFKNIPLNDANWYNTGHYTQMVWKSTKSIGMGISKCTNGNYIIVANYNPAGNYMGEKAY